MRGSRVGQDVDQQQEEVRFLAYASFLSYKRRYIVATRLDVTRKFVKRRNVQERSDNFHVAPNTNVRLTSHPQRTGTDTYTMYTVYVALKYKGVSLSTLIFNTISASGSMFSGSATGIFYISK